MSSYFNNQTPEQKAAFTAQYAGYNAFVVSIKDDGAANILNAAKLVLKSVMVGMQDYRDPLASDVQDIMDAIDTLKIKRAEKFNKKA